MHSIQTKSLEPTVKNPTYLTCGKTWGGGNLMEISWYTHHSWKYSSFFSHSNPLSNSRLLLALCDFLCFYLTTWFLTFVRPFAPQVGGICIYVHACIGVYLCASDSLACFILCVCRLWENQTWRGTAGIPSDIAWPFCLAQSCSYTHTHAGGKVPQFKVWHKHYQVLYPHLKWDENQKSRLPRLSVALWGGSPHMFIRSVLTCLVNHIAEDCCESLDGLSHMSGHTWVCIQQIYCTLETAHKLCFY